LSCIIASPTAISSLQIMVADTHAAGFGMEFQELKNRRAACRTRHSVRKGAEYARSRKASAENCDQQDDYQQNTCADVHGQADFFSKQRDRRNRKQAVQDVRRQERNCPSKAVDSARAQAVAQILAAKERANAKAEAQAIRTTAEKELQALKVHVALAQTKSEEEAEMLQDQFSAKAAALLARREVATNAFSEDDEDWDVVAATSSADSSGPQRFDIADNDDDCIWAGADVDDWDIM